MIWQEALRMPQIVQLCFQFSKYNTVGALRHRVVPPLLQTCVTSRHLALQVYIDKLFERDRTLILAYMQTSIDTIYFGSANRGEDFDCTTELWAYFELRTLDPADVKHVAFELNYWMEQDTRIDMVYENRMFIGLETLTMVIEGESEPDHPAELVDLTDNEQRSLLGTYAPSLGVNNTAELLQRIRKDFETRFDEYEISHSFIPELRIKKLRGNILGKNSK